MSVTQVDDEVRRAVFDRYRDRKGRIRCAGCRRVFPSSALELDHIIPEIESRPDMRANPANLQPLCKTLKGVPGCHARKTAREAKERARRAQPPTDWLKVSFSFGVAGICAGAAWLTFNGGHPISAGDWIQYSVEAEALTFLTYLIQNGFRHRAPRKKIQPQPVSENVPQPARLDTERIVNAAREIIGAKGVVKVIVVDVDDFTISYYGTGFADHEDESKLELLQKIQAKIGDRWLPWWDTEHDKVRFTRRPALPLKIPHPGFAKERKWHMLPVAEGIAFDLNVTSHLLIVGATNAGKTALMRCLIAAACDSAAKGEVELLLADPKQIELLGFEGWPGVRRIVTETEELWDMAFDLEAEMNERYRQYRVNKVPLNSHKRLIVVIDEYEQYFKRMFNRWTSGAKDEDGQPLKRPGQRLPGPIIAIQSVLSMARRCGIHLIIGTQSPDATWFGGTGTRENCGGRATVGPVDAVRSKMMFDDSSWGRDIPADIKGRATIQVGNGKPVECQVYWLPDPGDPDNDHTAEDWDVIRRVKAA